jgi:pentatricopeptide repeat protein
MTDRTTATSQVELMAPELNESDQPLHFGESRLDEADEQAAFSHGPSAPEDDEEGAATTTVSLENAIEQLGMGFSQYMILTATGLCFAIDAMQVVLLSFVSIILKHLWNLSSTQTASLTSVIFAGAMVGTLLLGPLADRIGRKPVFVLTNCIICFCSLCTACFANSYASVITTSFGVGVGVGGLCVPFDLLAECLPKTGRGTNLLLIEYFWTFGCLYVVVVAALLTQIFSDSHHSAVASSSVQPISSEGGSSDIWRWMIVLASLPSLLSLVVGFWYLPESPRWLCSRGQHTKAMEVLKQMERRNHSFARFYQYFLSQPPPQNEEMSLSVPLVPLQNPQSLIFAPGVMLQPEIVSEHQSSLRDLFRPQWRYITVLLWCVWCLFAFGYYGTILSVTKVFSSYEAVEGTWATNGAGRTYQFDYTAIFISSAAEFVGTTLVISAIDRIGRIPCQVISYVGAGCSVFMLCRMASFSESAESTTGTHWWLLILFGLMARVFEMAGTCATWVSTAEILTTEVRATGHGTANAMARIGAFACPYVVQQGFSLTQIATIMLTTHVACAMCAALLPETKGCEMDAVVQVAENTTRASDEDHIDQDSENQSLP